MTMSNRLSRRTGHKRAPSTRTASTRVEQLLNHQDFKYILVKRSM